MAWAFASLVALLRPHLQHLEHDTPAKKLDLVLIMSNGGFGGIHTRLLRALGGRQSTAAGGEVVAS